MKNYKFHFSFGPQLFTITLFFFFLYSHCSACNLDLFLFLFFSFFFFLFSFFFFIQPVHLLIVIETQHIYSDEFFSSEGFMELNLEIFFADSMPSANLLA